jgi:hypothetical protein
MPAENQPITIESLQAELRAVEKTRAAKRAELAEIAKRTKEVRAMLEHLKKFGSTRGQ